MVQRLNATLHRSTSHLGDIEIRWCLESGLDDDLKSRAQLEQAHDTKDLLKWVQQIRDIDSCSQLDHKHFLTFLTTFDADRSM